MTKKEAEHYLSEAKWELENFSRTSRACSKKLAEATEFLLKELNKPLWIGAEVELDDNTVKILVGINQEDGDSLDYTTTADIEWYKEYSRENNNPWISSKEDLVVSRNSNEVIFDEEHDLIR